MILKAALLSIKGLEVDVQIAEHCKQDAWEQKVVQCVTSLADRPAPEDDPARLPAAKCLDSLTEKQYMALFDDVVWQPSADQMAAGLDAQP